MISRQRAWQLRKIAAGMCAQCGKRRRVNRQHCLACREKSRTFNQKARDAKTAIDKSEKTA